MGGAATNSGINYQQRVAAMVLAAQYTGFDLSWAFGTAQKLVVESVYFETDDPIDDLKVKCENQILFLQIKRTLTLQTAEGTDLFKSIDQFVKQYIESSSTIDCFVLVTSPQSSRSVTQDLNKITESIRLNDTSFHANPLNETERLTFNKFKTLFNDLYEKKAMKKPSEDQFVDFSKKVYISIIDIEKGKPDERVALVLLEGEKLIDSSLVWKMLIANCLEYGRKRQSINLTYLKEILDRYRNEKPKLSSTSDDAIEDLLKTAISQKGRFPVAKEVLLIESFTDNADYLITELYRFTEDGQIKHRFQGNKIKLRDSDDEWTLIYRAATFAGVERYISENIDNLEKNRIAIIPANDIDRVEDSEAAKLHRNFLSNLQNQNKDILKCLHCDKIIDPQGSVLIEVDDMDTKPAIGAVHIKCVRVVDRVLGTIGLPKDSKKNEYLPNFDYKEWARLMLKGQGMMNQLREIVALQGREKVISWSSENKEFRDYSYCIKFTLSDGSTRHMFDRGKIHRFAKLDAEETEEQFKGLIAKGKKEKKPIGYTSKNVVYGSYNELLQLKDTDESILEIESVAIDKYSKLLEKRDEHIHFYAPICILRDIEDESIINIGNGVPLISDPLTFRQILDSWQKAGIDLQLEKIELKIIRSDTEFDGYMRSFFADGMMPIVDPLFNKNGELVKGTKIMHMQQQFATRNEEYRKSVRNPNWLKGDKVRLEIPSITDDNYPIGVLLEDEFQGDDGQRYVIFRPVEDGKELEDLAYAVPSRIVAKAR
ncbi:hypothetical protein [Xanthomarina gelatinilytica]|uniref:hypothetical protein n=1 Tax=Xanthomarina gelatinilytica TaxID=1137281 RepID=UPI003AA850AF